MTETDAAWARAIGRPVREVMRLRAAFPGCFPVCALDSKGAVERLLRWADLDTPDADARDLAITGDDRVTAIVVDTVAAMPRFPRWHAITHVFWTSPTKQAQGIQRTAPLMPAPIGDTLHVIELANNVDDVVLAGVIAHEIGHSVDSQPQPQPFRQKARGLAELVKAHADQVDAIREDPEAEKFLDDAAELRLERELMADRLASAFGYPRRLERWRRPGYADQKRAQLRADLAPDLATTVEAAAADKEEP